MTFHDQQKNTKEIISKFYSNKISVTKETYVTFQSFLG